MAKVSYKELQKRYSGMYVLSEKPREKILAASRNLGKAFNEALKKGNSNPAVEYIEPTGVIVLYAVKVSVRK